MKGLHPKYERLIVEFCDKVGLGEEYMLLGFKRLMQKHTVYPNSYLEDNNDEISTVFKYYD